MKNKILNFSGVALNVSFDRDIADTAVNWITEGCLQDTYTGKPDEIIYTLNDLSNKDKSNFMEKIDTSLTGDFLIKEGDNLSEEIRENSKELENIMRIMYTYEALQSGDTNLIKSTLKKILYYLDSQFQRDNSDELLEEYINNMSEDEMKSYLQNYLKDNIKESSFLSGIILEKIESDSNNKNKSYRENSNSTTTIPSIKAITSDNNTKQDDQTEIIKQIKKQDINKDILQSEEKVKENNNKSDNKKESKNIKTNILNSSSIKENNKKSPSLNTNNTKTNNNSINSKSLGTSIGHVAEGTIETVKDLIANTDNIKKNISGKISSSVTSLTGVGHKTIKPLVKVASKDTGNTSAVLPGVAGLSTAAVAGIGTKLYIDKKEENEKENTIFFNDSNIEEQPIIEKTNEQVLSKEDLVSILENKF